MTENKISHLLASLIKDLSRYMIFHLPVVECNLRLFIWLCEKRVSQNHYCCTFLFLSIASVELCIS